MKKTKKSSARKSTPVKKKPSQKSRIFGKSKLTNSGRLIRKSKAFVDDILLKLSPSVQSRIDKLSQTVESGTVSISELKAIGLKVLQKAINISRNLQKKGSARKG